MDRLNPSSYITMEASSPRMIELAAEAGYDLAGVRMMPTIPGDNPDEKRLTETFGALCDAAASFGLSVNLEFTPWTLVNNAAAARRVVSNAGRENGEILIDLIHVARSAKSLDDIAAIEAERTRYFQICDAPAGTSTDREELLFTARRERLLPGEGGVDVAGVVQVWPRDLIVSIAIPSHSRLTAMEPARAGDLPALHGGRRYFGTGDRGR